MSLDTLGELNSGLDTSSVRQKYIKDVAWSSSLVSRLERKFPSDFSERRIQKSLYRPFLNKIYTLIQNQDLHIDQVDGNTFSRILKQRIWLFVHLG